MKNKLSLNGRYDITTKKDYHNSWLKKYEVFCVLENIFEIGVTDVKTPFGNMVKAYDMERCICDLIRSKKRKP